MYSKGYGESEQDFAAYMGHMWGGLDLYIYIYIYHHAQLTVDYWRLEHVVRFKHKISYILQAPNSVSPLFFLFS